MFLTHVRAAGTPLDELPVLWLAVTGTVEWFLDNVVGPIMDLLAEVCIALRFAGQVPSETWEHWLASQARHFVI